MEDINNLQNDIDYDNNLAYDNNLDNNRIKVEQSGGFVDILFFLLTPFIAVVSFIINLIISLKDLLFSENIIPVYKDLGDWKFGSPDGQGVFWKYLWWCIKTSLYLVIFLLGGIGVSFVGIIMIYKKLFSKFSTPTSEDKDIPDATKNKIADEELAERENEEAGE